MLPSPRADTDRRGTGRDSLTSRLEGGERQQILTFTRPMTSHDASDGDLALE